MSVWTDIIVLILGAAVGSFLNVVILRTHRDASWWSGRSACPHCGTVLQWYELIPVLSFGIQRGRCRHCHKALTRQYVIVELLTAAMFFLVFLSFGASWTTLVGWFAGSAMLALAVYDARWSLLPDAFSIVFALFAVGASLVMHRPWLDIVIGGAGGAVFFGLQFWLSRGRWVGSGDILLGAGLGLLLGWRMLALGLFIAYFVGSVIAAVLILTKRLKASSSMPFGPYLLGGGFAAWLYGEQIVNWYFRYAIFR